jgi:hypothetical protein
MNRRFFSTVALAAVWGLCGACARTAEGLSMVTGRVVCNGQPAAGAVLLFHRQAAEPAPPPDAAAIVPSATVAEDGSFSVESHPLGSGAAPGKYSILVNWPEIPPDGAPQARAKTAKVKGKTVFAAKGDKGVAEPTDRLKGRYMNPAKPLLQTEVKPGPTDVGTLELDLKN